MPSDYLHLEPPFVCVLHRGSQDSVEIALFDVVGIHEHQLAHPKANELFDDRAACSRASDHGNAKAAKERSRAGSEQLGVTIDECRDRRLRFVRPEDNIVAYDFDMPNRRERSAGELLPALAIRPSGSMIALGMRTVAIDSSRRLTRTG